MKKTFDSEGVIQRINQLSKDRGVSLTKALRDCGYKDLVANIQKGSIPSVDKFLVIADYFSVDIGWILTGEIKMLKDLPPTQEKENLLMDEKILLNNYRDMEDKDKEDLQSQAARMLSCKKNAGKRGTTSRNIEEGDGELEGLTEKKNVG